MHQLAGLLRFCRVLNYGKWKCPDKIWGSTVSYPWRATSYYRRLSQQRLRCICRSHRLNCLVELRSWAASRYGSDVAHKLSRIAFDRANLCEVFRCNDVLPFNPELPTIWHSVRQLNIHKLHFFPM